MCFMFWRLKHTAVNLGLQYHTWELPVSWLVTLHIDIMCVINLNFMFLWIIIFTRVKCVESPKAPKDMFPESSPYDGVFRSMYANEYRDFINRTILFSVIPPFSSSSLSDCSISCLRYYCNGFIYNSDKSECRLIHHRYYNINITEVEVGSRYYMTSYGEFFYVVW
jgi:hypothetical protein